MRIQSTSGTNTGFDSVGRTYHPSGKRGGGDDGPAVSAGFSCAIIHHQEMGGVEEFEDIVDERDAMGLRVRARTILWGSGLGLAIPKWVHHSVDSYSHLQVLRLLLIAAELLVKILKIVFEPYCGVDTTARLMKI
jgi:hypothetical protein